MKAKYSFHTYSIVEDVVYGASSQRIGLKKKWDVNAEGTIPNAEASTANNRSDVKQLLDDVVATAEIFETKTFRRIHAPLMLGSKKRSIRPSTSH